MGRDLYAFRDLDEELHSFVDDENSVAAARQYLPHHSPPDAKAKKPTSTKNLNGLSESTMLKMYVDHHKAQRRRKLLGVALFTGVALLGVVPVLLASQSTDSNINVLELAVSAPYRAMRLRGETHPQFDPLTENAEDIDSDDEWTAQDAQVGDADPHDQEETPDSETIVHEIVEGTIITVTSEDDEDEEPVQGDAPLDGVEDDTVRGELTASNQKLVRVVTDNEEDEEDADETPDVV